MSFIQYYLVFFPILILLFYSVRFFTKKLSKYIILLVSIFFLLYLDSLSFYILCILCLINYLFIKLIIKGFNKNILRSLGIIINLLPLFYYKYINSYVLIETNDTNMFLGIPLGLSFYVLQQITALFDATKKENLDKFNFINYLFFSFFFIYIISGPLTPYKKVIKQFDCIFKYKISIENITIGLSLFILGFAKKTILADPIKERIDSFYLVANSHSEVQFSIIELFYIAWGNTVEFYFSFSAFSDMAIGMALCFGIILPINFNSPLKTKTPMEYISSWHMSFMSFVREYIFQPSFMLLKKLPIKNLEFKYTFAWSISVFLTFFLTGAWHAPVQTSILISTFVAIIMVSIELLKRFISLPNTFNNLANFLSRILLLFMIIITSTYFRTPDNIDIENLFFNNIYLSLPNSFSEILYFLKPYNIYFEGIFPSNKYLEIAPLLWEGRAILHIFICTIIIFLFPNTMEIFNLVDSNKYSLFKIKWQNNIKNAILIGILFTFCLLLLDNNSGFIYGQ
ncbi:hypothetical protein CP985_13040 [Malaciobacter mytili LMG 24559]|uniref:Membrane-bound O-acyl transferase, MBOAT family n=1 Tax=Malaciobacter mytili LMG 24559 TaxID=1032238 RepID=A0AAX2AF75_9BACT|nr:MBOAT family O-acyltransferase [Malaciobacter mytili]AXH16218.1 membrane-bound O-acyl transferase, MBOAT family [Malaciobacter mytili LMG 24559]RXK13725.1 hypothetical protein CP985_13040 [Malaciobacter mytili LMG 24559]